MFSLIDMERMLVGILKSISLYIIIISWYKDNKHNCRKLFLC